MRNPARSEAATAVKIFSEYVEAIFEDVIKVVVRVVVEDDFNVCYAFQNRCFRRIRKKGV